MVQCVDASSNNNHWVGITHNLIFNSQWDYAKSFSLDNLRKCTESNYRKLGTIYKYTRLSRKRRKGRKRRQKSGANKRKRESATSGTFLKKSKSVHVECSMVRALLNDKNLELLDKFIKDISTKGDDEAVITLGNDSITKRRFVGIMDKEWLSSDVMNMYMKLLMERDIALIKAGVRTASSVFFPSFFYTNLAEDNLQKKNIDSVSNYSWKVGKINLNDTGKFVFDKDKLFFPINVRNSHWTLVVVFIRLEELRYYDSLCSNDNTYDFGIKIMKTIYEKFIKEAYYFMKKKKIEKDWGLKNVSKYSPQQKNGYDCGVYALMMADILSVDENIVITQKDATIFRHRLAYALMSKQLII